MTDRDALVSLLEGTTDLPANELARVVEIAGRVLGADSARVLVADYGLSSRQEPGHDGPTGPRQMIEGTLAGRAFARDEIVVSDAEPDGEQFGVERLADFLVRATLDDVFPAETVRRPSASIMGYNGADLSDDATLLLIDYHGAGN